MLRSLSVQNYALIEAIQLPLQKGMTAITGETGSGKSILLGAFGLLLGERADSKAIRDESYKCIVEADFDLTGYGLESFFTEHDLDFAENTTIRREIAPGGKSRAFINDTPVQLNTLKLLGASLVDIHSQHENSLLGQRSFQYSIVDAFAGNSAVFARYTELFQQYRILRQSLEEARNNEARMRQEFDFITFQLAELDKAGIVEIDQIGLEQELDMLNNAENIRAVLAQVNTLMDGESHGALTAIGQARAVLGKIASYSNALGEFAQRLESCSIELKELTRELESFSGEVAVDEKRLEQIGEKLSQLYVLQKKHRMNSVEELLVLQEELRSKAADNDSFDDMITTLVTKLEKVSGEMQLIADELSESRHKAALAAQQEVKKYFRELSLDHAELLIEIRRASDFGPYGRDEISFLFKANKGGQLLPVQKVASGGEISRVMLAIKASISKHRKLPVLILDEIDQGVSGEVGKKIGKILKGMSTEMQLLVITHLPQIAGKAEHHLKVMKSSDKHTTSTYVQEITGEERINELAEMLSGKDISKAAIENAKELMG